MQAEPLTLAVNARFLTRPASGVDRVAIELLKAMAARTDTARFILLHPTGAPLHLGWLDALPPAMRAKLTLRPCGGGLRGHVWEQLALPFAARGLALLSLCSTGPLLRHNQAVMIHDAQVWDAPHSYSRAFRWLYRRLLPRLARRVRHVLTVSTFAQRRLEDLGIAPKGAVKVVPNGADHILRIQPDPHILGRLNLQPQGYLLAIGNLAPHKNLARLLEAAARRPGDAPELIVAGGMDARVFSDAGLRAAPGTRLIGRVSDGELRALYEGALALAFPSLTEGFGLPPVEAMACGCPVLATTGGAVPEICGNAAMLIDPTDTAAWTDAMSRVAADAALRAALIDKGHARAAGYRWDISAEMLVRLLSCPSA